MLLTIAVLLSWSSAAAQSLERQTERAATATGQALEETGEALAVGAEWLVENADSIIERTGELAATGAERVGAEIDRALLARSIGEVEGMAVVDEAGRPVGTVEAVLRTENGLSAVIDTGRAGNGGDRRVPLEHLRLADDTLILIAGAAAPKPAAGGSADHRID